MFSPSLKKSVVFLKYKLNPSLVVDGGFDAYVARTLGTKVLGLTGAKGGELATISGVCVKVPATETYMIQEYYLPICHCWCLMLEDKFFGYK